MGRLSQRRCPEDLLGWTFFDLCFRTSISQKVLRRAPEISVAFYESRWSNSARTITSPRLTPLAFRDLIGVVTGVLMGPPPAIERRDRGNHPPSRVPHHSLARSPPSNPAAEVWKGNGGVVKTGSLWRGVVVDDEDGFQERAAEVHAQNRLDRDFPLVRHIFQSEVYEIRGSELADGDGKLANKKFAESQRVLPDVVRPLLFAFLSSCPTRIYVKSTQRRYCEAEKAMKRWHSIGVVVHIQRGDLVPVE